MEKVIWPNPTPIYDIPHPSSNRKNFLNVIMGTHEKPTANIFNGKIINTFALNLKSNGTKISTHIPSIQFCTRDPMKWKVK